MSTPEPVFRRSSYSNGTGSNCLEAGTLDQGVAIRDSKNCDGDWGAYPAIKVPRSEWNMFLTAVATSSLTS